MIDPDSGDPGRALDGPGFRRRRADRAGARRGTLGADASGGGGNLSRKGETPLIAGRNRLTVRWFRERRNGIPLAVALRGRPRGEHRRVGLLRRDDRMSEGEPAGIGISPPVITPSNCDTAGAAPSAVRPR